MTRCVYCGTQVKEKNDTIFFILWECPACNSRSWFNRILDKAELTYRNGTHGKFSSVPEGCLFVPCEMEMT